MKSSGLMKVAVLNYSGNVGKSTLARHLLQPRMNECPIMFIESINEGGDETNIRGKDFPAAMIEVLVADEAIVDIGSSNIEQVFSKATQLGDILDSFDFFLVPTVSASKQQADTIKVLSDLAELGIATKKMKVVLNQVELDEDWNKSFEAVLAFAATLNITTAVVHKSEVFEQMAGRSLAECAAVGRDFRKEIAALSTREEKKQVAAALIRSTFAKATQEQFDKVFATLFGSK